MEQTGIPKNLIIGFTFVSLVVMNLMLAPGVYSRDFRMTGYLLPEGKADTAGAYILRHEGQRWVFRVTHVVTTSSPRHISSGYDMLNLTGRQQIRLTGLKESIRQLNHPEMTCKGITLYGTLYASKSILSLTGVERTSAKEQPKHCP